VSRWQPARGRVSYSSPCNTKGIMQRLGWLLLLGACGSCSNSTELPSVSFAEVYIGNYTTTSAPGQGFDATLRMTVTDPSRLEGTMSLPANTLPLPFVGAYAQNTVTLYVTAPLPYFAKGTATFTVSDGGNHLVGTMIGTDGAFAGQTFSIDLHRY
jgi:hypothetical protein